MHEIGHAFGSETLVPPIKKCCMKELITGKAKTFSDKYADIKGPSGYFCMSTIPITITRVEETLVEKPDKLVSVY